jgi:hypothetical protein
VRKKLAAIVAATSLTGSAVVLFAGGASAAPPTGGCPRGGDWFLVPISATIPGFDRGNFHDQNGDQQLCARSHKDGSWTLKDNNNPV